MLTMRAALRESTNLWARGGRAHKKGPNQGPGQERLIFNK
ncbi:hypothetical protein FHT86_005094 [Rhizobium sp. BK313]|nr:hypothetical protein [Rhizobium sp. BK313]